MLTQTKKPTSFKTINIEVEKNNEKEIVEAIKHMDIEMLAPLLNDRKKYQDFRKKEFLQLLNIVFERLKMVGDTFLEAHEGNCASCIIGTPGFTFVGNRSRKYFDMVFEKNKRGKLKDMYECGQFRNKPNCSFIKTERLSIDTALGNSMVW